ncbi:MAG: motility protein MotB [Betaproteobacteria bacterium]|nr:motility protein MotB [Betaproteobacteria bacterium]NDA33004.1 motility protein MotB [Betaproteobacteria bacterium]NDA35608.1 motility protein MotB [Betaproteobacteria bacterium]NDC69205.1 motility protein MotB [Betaproteobacteria bacterium]
MASAPGKELAPIVVKRVKKVVGGGHGGAWKIAYADFVTAMMAFFLLMWVLGSTTSGDLAGISAYFQNPLRLAMEGGQGSGDTRSVVKGGGDNVTKASGQEQRADSNSVQRKMSESEAYEQYNTKQKGQLEEMRAEVESQIAGDKSLEEYQKQIFMDVSTDGLRIQIVDEKNRPMFESGSAGMPDYAKKLMRVIGKVLAGSSQPLRIEGHTDGKPFPGAASGYTNWELSSDRANAARRELIAGGLEGSRVSQVVGYADSVKLNPEDPNDPMNRRISITILNARGAAKATGQPESQSPGGLQPAGTVPSSGGGATWVPNTSGSPKNAIKETMPKIVDNLPAFPAASFLGKGARGGDNGSSAAPSGGASSAAQSPAAPQNGAAPSSTPASAATGGASQRSMASGNAQDSQSQARPRSPGLTLPPPTR